MQLMARPGLAQHGLLSLARPPHSPRVMITSKAQQLLNAERADRDSGPWIPGLIDPTVAWLSGGSRRVWQREPDGHRSLEPIRVFNIWGERRRAETGRVAGRVAGLASRQSDITTWMPSTRPGAAALQLSAYNCGNAVLAC